MFWLLLLGLSIGFAVVRLAGMFGDLWLDEIWSLKMVGTISSLWEIFTKLQHDNNHPLNSLFLYALQPISTEWTCRLLAWVTGSASVGLAALIGRKQYRQWHRDAPVGDATRAGLLTAVIVGGSYLLIHYSSEARGYAPAVMFGLLAFYALLHAEEKNAGRWAVVYGLSCVLGLLAHLAVVQVMMAAAGWSLLILIRERAAWRQSLLRAIGWHLAPWLFLAVYYYGFVRKLEIGGGPENPLMGVLAELSAYALGLPLGQGMLALGLFTAVTLAGLILVARRSRELAGFYALVIVFTPVVGMVFSRFTLLFPRYFIISATFALLLAGYGLTRLWLSSRAGRIATAVVLALFLAGNGLHVARLVKEERGHYREALHTLAARTPFDDVTISSDHDFRNYALVDYYRGGAAPGKRIIYYPADRLPPWGTQWRLLHRIGDDAAFSKHVTDPLGNSYVLEQVYPCAGLSGWTWAVYRNFQLEPLD